MKTIQVTIDEPLLHRLDTAPTRCGSEARSAFIPRAVSEALLDLEEAEADIRGREAEALTPDNIHTVDVDDLDGQITSLSRPEMRLVRQALEYALGFREMSR